MLEGVLLRVLRRALGGGGAVDIDIPAEFATLVAALAAAVEAAMDTGTATGGSNTTIVDAGKSWAVNMWTDATFEVEIGAIRYLGIVLTNTADTITFAALPGAAAVIAGCDYGLKRPVDIADISDRAGRLLGVLSAGANLIGAVNPRSEAGAGQAPVAVNVTAATTEVLAANANRRVAIITNDSDTTMWFAIGQAAVAHASPRINANGGVLIISQTGDLFTTEAINLIHASAGNKVATAQELH